MPRREDERYSYMGGSHPRYCTCVSCTRRSLSRTNRNPVRELWGRLLNVFRRGKPVVHPADCGCSTCILLRSVGTGSGPAAQK